MKDIKWAGKLLSYRHTLSWFVTMYGSDGINLLRLAAERQSWKVAKAILVSFWHWHRRRALAASPAVVKAMVNLVSFGCRPGRLIDYLYKEGDDGALLLIKLAHVVGSSPQRFSSKESLLRHFTKHGHGSSSQAAYLEKAKEVFYGRLARTFLAYHTVAGRRYPRLCRFGAGGQFVSVNAAGYFSTYFRSNKKSVRAFMAEKESISSAFLL